MSENNDNEEEFMCNCTVCGCDFDLEGEGGQCGDIGILPVAFCPTCLNGIRDMAEQIWDLVPASWVEEYTDEGKEGME